MAVRFLEEGYEYLDPMSGASTAGAVITYDDGQPSLLMPWEDRPGYSQADMIASDALRWMGTPREQIMMARPPVPQQLFPPRFGYEHEPATIEDIFYGDWTPRPRSWVSPLTTVPSRREAEEQMWSGTDRNMSTSVNPLG
jgi:hypothetical protein